MNYLDRVKLFLYLLFLQCVGWCVGGGVQTRGVRCSEIEGCSAHRAPHSSQACSPKKQCDAQWFTGMFVKLYLRYPENLTLLFL